MSKITLAPVAPPGWQQQPLQAAITIDGGGSTTMAVKSTTTTASIRKPVQPRLSRFGNRSGRAVTGPPFRQPLTRY